MMSKREWARNYVVLPDLIIDLISASESIRHQLVIVLARELDALAGDDDDVVYRR